MILTNRHIDRLDSTQNARIARANDITKFYKGIASYLNDVWYNPDPSVKYIIYDTVSGSVLKIIR